MFPLCVPMIYRSLANFNASLDVLRTQPMHTILSPPTTKLLVASPLR